MFSPSEIRKWEPKNLSRFEIQDGELYHNSLYLDKRASKPRNWHKSATEPLIDMILEKVKDGDVIIDYGSGTGGSAIEISKKLESLSLDCTIILIDPLESWFSKAYHLLKSRPNTFFCRSMAKDEKGKYSFLSLDEIIGNNKVDIIVSSSTLHLIPPSALGSLFDQFSRSLKKGGKFFWSSGDISSLQIPTDYCLLHDPYRELLNLINADEEYQLIEQKLDSHILDSHRREISRVFPLANSIDFFENHLIKSDFQGEITNHIVYKTFEESQLFMKCQRLSVIAGAITDIQIRNQFIKNKLEEVFELLREKGYTDYNGYRTFWHYGAFWKAD